jgi:hypothetical protein
MRKGFGKVRCSPCDNDEVAVNMLLKCLETKKVRKEVLSRK